MAGSNITAHYARRVEEFLDAWELGGYTAVIARVRDSRGVMRDLYAGELRTLVGAAQEYAKTTEPEVPVEHKPAGRQLIEFWDRLKPEPGLEGKPDIEGLDASDPKAWEVDDDV